MKSGVLSLLRSASEKPLLKIKKKDKQNQVISGIFEFLFDQDT
jgi:hypothetical protein